MLKVTATELPRVMQCDGPVTLAEHTLPQSGELSEDQIEGNAAHRLMQMALLSEPDCSQFVGQTVNDNYIITDDMAEYLQPHVDWIKLQDQFYTEQPASWFPWGDDRITVAGRADIIGVSGNDLHVHDLKYGWRVVEPKNNWTLISHAIGWCIANGFQPDNVHFTIHQPRPWHAEGSIRTWSINVNQLQNLKNAIRDRLSAIGNTITTGTHCYRCPVAHACPSVRLAALAAVDVSVSSAGEPLDGSQLGHELALLERAKQVLDIRYKSLSAQAEGLMRAGNVVTGYGLEYAYGRDAWNKGVDAETVKLLTGVDVSTASLLTPKQAIKKGASEDIIAQLSGKPSRGFKVVPMDIQAQAKKLFS